jgi:hypothetical protein
MNADDRARLRRVLASFDEAGLVALANKGLVRRAQKDLEAGGVSHEEADSAVLVRGPGWVVTMPPDGPTRATDDTKASGVTRQILTATIYLRNQWAAETAESGALSAAAPAAPEVTPAAPEPPAPAADVKELEDALLSLSLDDLQKWAGKTTLREVLPLVRGGMPVEVEAHAGLTVRLVGHDVEARLLPGHGKTARALLDEVLTTAPRALHKRWVVTAVLAFQQSRGRTFEVEAPTAAAEDAGAARSRPQVLAAAQELLEGMVSTGLAHPSSRMLERLFTLSVSAVAVHLPRLARLLRALADEVSQVLARDAAADTARLFDQVCLTHALARALAAAGPQPPVALAGQHRTQYDPVGDLQLAGVGAYPWTTTSGYEGLTVLLWDQAAGRFRTWSVSRPAGTLGFNLAHCYRTETAWSGSGAPERFGRSRFTLRQAKANALGRLSGAEKTTVADLEPTDPARLDFGARAISNWAALFAHALALYPIGLRERDPLDRVFVLRPAKWGERFFDELQQRLSWPLLDENGAVVSLTLPWADVNEDAIEFLEAVNASRDRLTGVVARLLFDNRGVQVEPLSLLSEGTPGGDRVLNPAFDRARILSKQSDLLARLRQKFGRDRIATAMTADDEAGLDGVESVSAQGLPAGMQARLGEVERLLQQVAESGLGRLNEPTRQRFGQLAAELDRTGLRELARGVDELKQTGGASAVLSEGYLCRLHREAAAQARAGGGFS